MIQNKYGGIECKQKKLVQHGRNTANGTACQWKSMENSTVHTQMHTNTQFQLKRCQSTSQPLWFASNVRQFFAEHRIIRCLHKTVFRLNDILWCLVHAHLTTFIRFASFHSLSLSLFYSFSPMLIHRPNYSSQMSMAFCTRNVSISVAGAGAGQRVDSTDSICRTKDNWWSHRKPFYLYVH